MDRTFALLAGLLISYLGLALPAQAQLIVQARDTVPPVGAIRVFAVNDGDVNGATEWIRGEGEESGPRVWDFRVAPGVGSHRYFYRQPDGAEDDLFPGTEVAERLSKNDEPATDIAFLRYLPGEGKETLGFSTISGGLKSESPFSDPLLEIPDSIELGERWDDETRFDVTLEILGAPIVASTVIEQKVEVDAWGEVILPDIGSVEVLRINVLAIWTNEAVILGRIAPLGEVFIRTYIWIAKGYGNVATIVSKEDTTKEPPELFTTAATFERLRSATGFWEEPVSPTSPTPGTISITSSRSQFNLQWQFPDATEGAVYVVEKSSALGQGDDAWEAVIETNDTHWNFPENAGGAEYYRVRLKGS
jgi:hypothetical protein